MTDADQRPTPKDSAQAAAVGAEPADASATAEVERSAPDRAAGVAEGGEGAGAAAGAGHAEPRPAASAPDAPLGQPKPQAQPGDQVPAASDDPFAPPPEDLPPAPNPWAPPPEQPYGQVRPGPVQPWGTQRPRPPERPVQNWGDPNRYGPVQDPRNKPQNDPDRRYRDQRELDRQPQRRERDMPTRWALGLSVGATVCTMLAILQGLATFPSWMVGAGAGLALAIGAFVMSIRAQQSAAAHGRRTSEATASLVSSVVTGSLALLLLVASIVWFNQFNAYAKCMATAGTQASQDVCRQQLEQSTGMQMR